MWKTDKCIKAKKGKFTISVCKWDGMKLQGLHFAFHFGFALCIEILFGWGVLISLLVALGVEIWDGFKQHNREGRPPEGFNIYPDLVFRSAGALLLYFTKFSFWG